MLKHLAGPALQRGVGALANRRLVAEHDRTRIAVHTRSIALIIAAVEKADAQARWRPPSQTMPASVPTGQAPEERCPNSRLRLKLSDKQITLFDSLGFATEDSSPLRCNRLKLEERPLAENLDRLADPNEPRNLFAMLLRAGA